MLRSLTITLLVSFSPLVLARGESCFNSPDGGISSKTKAIEDVLAADQRELYEEIKKEFLASPMCKPDLVLNDPKKKLNPYIAREAFVRLRFLKDGESSEAKLEQFQEIAEDFGLSEETVRFAQSQIENENDSSESRELMQSRIIGTVIKDLESISKRTDNFQSGFIKKKLADNGVFTRNAQGKVVCPFVSFDAFQKSLTGLGNVLHTSKDKLNDTAKINRKFLTNPNLITIVDYSRPSVERRMFVIDLKNKKVLHNTWVAHGGGPDGKLRKEVRTSNVKESNLSSEGFYVAKKQGQGDRFGLNVILAGMDRNNTNMEDRHIIVHGWHSPFTPLYQGYKDYLNTDFTKASAKELKAKLEFIDKKTIRPGSLGPTEGCLGVPSRNLSHLDRKHRNKTQLELIRDDIPGSLMFNYTGPEMASDYLN